MAVAQLAGDAVEFVTEQHVINIALSIHKCEVLAGANRNGLEKRVALG